MSENNKQNLMEDAEDDGLKAVMGDKFRDMSSNTRSAVDKEIATPVSGLVRNDSGSRQAKQERKAAVAAEVPTYAPNWFDRLKGCSKYALVSGLLVALFWYWNITGHMDSYAAIPCMVVCGTLGGFKIGNVCRG